MSHDAHVFPPFAAPSVHSSEHFAAAHAPFTHPDP
jgi:hypothetical protein